MSSGQPKACWINIEVGRYVMLDQWPYKPFEIAGMGEDYVRLEDSNTGSSRRMTPKEFDAAGYVFAEADTERTDMVATNPEATTGTSNPPKSRPPQPLNEEWLDEILNKLINERSYYGIYEAKAAIHTHYREELEGALACSVTPTAGDKQVAASVEIANQRQQIWNDISEIIDEFGDQIPLVFTCIREYFEGDGEQNVR